VDYPRVHHADHPTRALWAQEMGADSTEDGGEKLASGKREVLQYHKPWHR
jgi:hypothetical protein